MRPSLAAGLFLGALFGMRHALEPDHLAAVSLLVLRKGARRGPLAVGALWGLGHTLALLAVSCLVAALGASLPAKLFDGFECLVAAMLLALGIRALARSRDDHPHTHDVPSGRRPLFVGLIHGLAGSGALTAFAMATLPTNGARFLYVAFFGAGSLCGMACLTSLAGWPLARWAREGQPLHRPLTRATAAGSVLLGGFWGCRALVGLLGT